ncbi:hypothetical protein SAMN04488128_102733 [Chitinophaga eiseniae]|uniref:Polyketide cyclase / dehydrase and lipid transport n=1 Tax=Chitinophaga eiseniae TaxID=634771 RepID=A0A1T4R0Q3_9BACT|nr:hypothetical protein [Chitinophaga eiseniae]SKA09642.1 hypothetical protein SAMN04488128_102733 [Chitinophaga eiseniae]
MSFPGPFQKLWRFVVPVVFALVMYAIFNDGMSTLFSLMGLAFLIGVPFGIGALTIYFSPREAVESRAYRILAPWVPIIIFFVVTLLLAMEGWACWLMILPLFLLAASAGGAVAGRFKRRDTDKEERTYISLIVLLPLIVSPIEQLIGKIPGQYKAYTYIDIHAGKEAIWKNVTRVGEIAAAQDKGWFTRMLGFPRPIKAELNYEGVGAYRKAIFDKGLVFDERVTAYNHQRSMRFTIHADPYNIPSTTMDEHIVIGGEYFDVLDGTYELEPLSNGIYRLHLYSHFKLHTTFNFYASWWASWIMKDIQNNILQVIRQRAESGLPEDRI